MKKKKVLFISSTGGHLKELLQLKKLFGKYDSYLITEKTDSTKKLKDEYKEKMGYMVFGTKDHMLTYPFKLLANCFISVYYFIKIRPKYIVTTGTHTAGPICYLGKIFGSKIIYIETMANIVPDDMICTISLFTIPLAFLGSSVCSHIATL